MIDGKIYRGTFFPAERMRDNVVRIPRLVKEGDQRTNFVRMRLGVLLGLS